MSLHDRLLAIDRCLIPVHLVLNDIARCQAAPTKEALSAVIADLTQAREMLTDLATEPPPN